MPGLVRLPAGITDGRRLPIATLAACLVLEPGAWAHNVIRDAAEPALFHPQPTPADALASVLVTASDDRGVKRYGRDSLPGARHRVLLRS